MHLETDFSASHMFGRRDVLWAGFLGFGGLTLGQAARLQAASGTTATDTSVILLFLHGGPSHLETYDMKPLANTDIRGPFEPIPTNVPGIDVCEHLPKHAKIADKFSLIRSCTHDEADHFAGHRRFLSGFGKLKPGFGYESYYPMVGAVANRLLTAPQGMPPAVSVGGVVVNGPDYASGISEGYWSPVYRVPIVNGGLANASLTVPVDRLRNRRELQTGLDRLRRNIDGSGMMSALDTFDQQAVEMLVSQRAERAFNLNLEDPRVRARYGEGYGQEVLTARRLVEAGVRFVSVCDRGSGPGSNAHNWDDHAVNWDMRTAMLARFPQYDHIITTLIEDLYDRGLTEKVLLVVTGEFGRTPRLEFNNGKIGRDHWPSAMSILLTGGGIKTGQVIGATDAIGARPSQRPIDPHDFLATIYQFLGIDPHLHLPDPQGRPIALTHGSPINELW